jgi:predicted Zn-dependent protease
VHPRPRIPLLVLAAALALAPAPGARAGERTVLMEDSGGDDARAPRRDVLLTEADDARVGREASKQVAAEIGLVDDPELVAYVRRIGSTLLRGVPRRPYPFEFHVVDQTEPNAFALPGGYVFVARGLLALMNSEDELANVIGHEITHAVLRHAAAREALAAQQAPLSMPWTRAANLAAYGRDMERDADRGGQQLAAAAGYDPNGMATFLKSLEQWERVQRGFNRRPSFFDTHPGSRERAATNSMRAKEIRWKRDASRGDTHAAYLRELDGMPLGERPEAGVFLDRTFVHPVLGFQINFPPGWSTSNSNLVVGAVAPRGEAVVFLRADQPAGDPRAVAEKWVEKERGGDTRIQVVESEAVRIGPSEAWRLELDVGSRGGSLFSLVAFVPYQKATWTITGIASAREAERFRGPLLGTLRSFRPLGPDVPTTFEAQTLRVVEARAGEDLGALGRRTGNAWDPTTTAVANGLFPDHRFAGGERVKVARSEPWRAPRR